MTTLLLHPALADCRRLFLRGHVVPTRIGVHAFEKQAAQRLVFNVDLYVPLAGSTPRADRIEEVVDYDFIRQTAHPGVRAARVSTEKPDVYPDCEAVGCEVFGINGAV
jgi:7,8-dihydroneopterin aldolase/epimerase/oxygenase